MMVIKWFGEPWGVGGRAPICETDENKIPAPVDSHCIDCGEPIKENDKGVVTACSPSIWDHWILEFKGVQYSVCSYHLHCWLREVVGGEMSAKILARMRERPVLDDFKTPSQVTPSDSDVVVGRGWKKADPVVTDDDPVEESDDIISRGITNSWLGQDDEDSG